MLAADAVKRSHDAATNQREYALNRIGVHIRSEPDILSDLVLYDFMPALELLCRFAIRGKFIGDDAAREVRILFNELADILARDSLHHLKTHATATLHDRHNWSLRSSASFF